MVDSSRDKPASSVPPMAWWIGSRCPVPPSQRRRAERWPSAPTRRRQRMVAAPASVWTSSPGRSPTRTGRAVAGRRTWAPRAAASASRAACSAGWATLIAPRALPATPPPMMATSTLEGTSVDWRWRVAVMDAIPRAAEGCGSNIKVKGDATERRGLGVGLADDVSDQHEGQRHPLGDRGVQPTLAQVLASVGEPVLEPDREDRQEGDEVVAD